MEDMEGQQPFAAPAGEREHFPPDFVVLVGESGPYRRATGRGAPAHRPLHVLRVRSVVTGAASGGMSFRGPEPRVSLPPTRRHSRDYVAMTAW